MSATASSTQQSTAQFIAHFIRSIKDVLSTMAKTNVHVGPPDLKKDPVTTHDVSGIIGFSGEFSGSMVLSFEVGTAKAIASAFAGAPLDPSSPDFADAVGELANMIAGGAKKSFGGDNSISVPSIVMGKGHTIARLNDVPCIIIPCRTDHGNFAVEVSIKNRATKPNQ
jgi:chemotaxis protein CheX